jgi:hypothetical protein
VTGDIVGFLAWEIQPDGAMWERKWREGHFGGAVKGLIFSQILVDVHVL